MDELLLVFENATIYNEPGSIIYQDALILHKVAIDSLHYGTLLTYFQIVIWVSNLMYPSHT